MTPAGTKRRQVKVRLGTLAELPKKNAALNKLAEKMGIAPKRDTTFQQSATRWQAAFGPTYKKTTIDTYVRILTARVLPLFKDTRIDVINIGDDPKLSEEGGQRLFQIHTAHDDGAGADSGLGLQE